ncbi:hypothetical protein GOV09_04210 [Candidatus Woesearchaeota archaeon]|nr:hypothetical protein [Candidatus Woesearchaeota archaeon]
MRKKQKNHGKYAMSIFLALIMVTSILGFIFGGSFNTTNPTSRYEGTKFTLSQNGWDFSHEGQRYTLSYIPQDVEFLSLPSTIDLSNLVQLDITSEFNSTANEDIARATFELGNVLVNKDIFVRLGFTTNASIRHPTITCESSSSFVPILYYNSTPMDTITHQGNCIVINSVDPQFILSHTNLIAYKILGIV